MLDFLIIPFTGFLSRCHGGGGVNLPLSIETWIISFCVGLTSISLLSGVPFIYEMACFLFSFSFAVLGIRTGHGQYMTLPPLHYLDDISTPEFIEPIVSFFFGKDPKLSDEYKKYPPYSEKRKNIIKKYGLKKAYFRNIFGLGITGFIVTLGPFITACLVGNTLVAFLSFLLGFGKVFFYIVGWKWGKEGKETVIGEWGRGILLGILFYILVT